MNRALKDPVLSGAPQWALFGVCACSLLFGGCQCEVSRSIFSPFKVLILVHGQSLSIAAQQTITVTSFKRHLFLQILWLARVHLYSCQELHVVAGKPKMSSVMLHA